MHEQAIKYLIRELRKLIEQTNPFKKMDYEIVITKDTAVVNYKVKEN